ncbi:MAG: dockerin type I domain-containing protein [Anaerofustis sp.]
MSRFKNKLLMTALSVVVITFLMSSGIRLGSSVFDLSDTVHAATYTVDIANANQTYSTQGSYGTYAEAYSAFSSNGDINAVIRDDTGKVLAMKRGMAVTQSSASTLTFTSTYPGGTQTYVSNNYVAYYQSTDANQVVTLTISGYTGTCSVNDVILIPGSFAYPLAKYSLHDNQYEFDYYTRNDSGDLVHFISYYHKSSNGDYYCSDFYSAIALDKAPSFMTKNVRYYSTDGIYFYTDPYDAAAGNTAASSYVGSYAIYYKWLSYRTTTSYSADQLNGFIAYKNSTVSTSTACAYLGYGSTFLSYGDTYGVNAAMEIAFANHESNYGKSSFAVNNYNFFGVDATDADPSGASTYASPSDGIMRHMKYLMNQGYLDAYAYLDYSKTLSYYQCPSYYPDLYRYRGDARYFGNCPGNKLIGINVKYASDPFHGEKVAAKMYELDKYLGSKDYNCYSIGFTNKVTYAYSQPTDTSWKLYKYTSKDPSRSTGSYSTVPIGMSVTIIGESGDYYQIVSDMPVNSDGLAFFTFDKSNTSNLSYIAYVKKSDITLLRNNLSSGGGTGGGTTVTPVALTSSVYTVNQTNGVISKIASGTQINSFIGQFSNGSVQVYNGSTQLTSGTLCTGMTVKIYDGSGNYVTDYIIVVTGDINGDGSINITDLIQIKRQILGTASLSGVYLKAADTNGDGATNITDLIQIKRSILGTQSITPN